ncbi:MAG: hypothetical protein ACF8GE_01590 [Phycisphaerales bacterium JB043]
MPQRILINAERYGQAAALALDTFRRFARARGHYNNTPNSHLRGKIGEIACDCWLQGEGIETEAVFQDLDRMREADLVLGTRRIDVKTWDERYWGEMGRCVAVAQIERLRAKADGVLWCVTPSELGPEIEVEIVGWNTIDDITRAPRRTTGPAGRRQVDNYQVDLDAVRQLDELLRSI